MNAKEKNTNANQPDLQLAFDVGHSSIGWAVFKRTSGSDPLDVSVEGCGVLTFPNDDCLASKRRQFRSMRRHARSTRMRVERLAKLLMQLLRDRGDADAGKLLKELHAYEDRSPQKRAELQGKGNGAPWLIAARVLAASRKGDREAAKLDWLELWHVLRWYAHNRGYDHETWGDAIEETLTQAERAEKQKDTEKVEKARALMKELGSDTMAETIFRYLFKPHGLQEPGSVEALPFFQQYFKGKKCAFEREIVREEVRRILQAQQSLFASTDLDGDAFITALLDDWRVAERIKPGKSVCGKRGEKERIWLPRRYGKRQPDGTLVNGGLLFGRLSARFLNRIISSCPLTGEKVPNKHCLEFLEFRWAEQVAKIQIEAPVPSGEEAQFPNYKTGEMRRLSCSERRKLDALARARGFLRYQAPKPDKKTNTLKGGVNDLEEILKQATNCQRSNLEKIFLVPDIEQALRIVPISGSAEATTAFQATWGCFNAPMHDKAGLYRDDPLRHRFTTQLLRGNELSAASITADLKRLGYDQLAERILTAVRAKATDKKGRINEAKAAALLNAPFYCEKLSGRAPFSRRKLREAVQEVFHPIQLKHPLEKGGCLEQTDEVKRRGLDRSLEDLTNNHLVRQRLHMLERLFKGLVNEYAVGDPMRVERITIEVARDLQKMSGMDSKAKKSLLREAHAHFDKVSEKVAEAIAAENELRVAAGQKPIPMSYNLIRKCRIADDLGWNPQTKAWPCPYTLRSFTVVDLVHGRYDKDHIIPRSKRLSDALEAMVITSRDMNGEKGQRTALEFIRYMNRPENEEKRKRLGIRTEADFRVFVESLPPKFDPFAAARAGRKVSDDDKRRWRRKQLLLTEKWEEDEFVPGDLTKTAHIMKLARQRLEAQYKTVSVEERPPILNIPGAVTAAFRDKSWKLLSELAAVHPSVKKTHEQAEKVRAAGQDFNFKKALRSITRLHHAVDAVAIGLIANHLIPAGSAARAGLNDTLSRFIIKAKLSALERRQFESLRHQLGLPKFYRWSGGRCDDPRAKTPESEEGGQLCIDDLPANLKAQVRTRLLERRVAQHVPSDMSGLGRRLTQNTRGILSVRDAKGNVLWLRGRNTDEELCGLASRTDFRDLELELTASTDLDKGESGAPAKSSNSHKPVPVNQVLGFAPVHGIGKLTPMRGVRVIRDNYGIAILDHAAPGEEKFRIVPQCKVWKQIFDEETGLVARNAGKPPRILRNGMLIRLKNTKPDKDGKVRDGIWMIRSVKATLKLDMTHADAPDVQDSGYGMWREVSVTSLGPENIEIIPKSLTGVAHITAACPTTSSA